MLKSSETKNNTRRPHDNKKKRVGVSIAHPLIAVYDFKLSLAILFIR